MKLIYSDYPLEYPLWTNGTIVWMESVMKNCISTFSTVQLNATATSHCRRKNLNMWWMFWILVSMFTRLLKNSCLLNVKNVKRFSNSAQLQIWSEKLADAVTPLWRIPYSEQLAIKDERNLSIIRKLTKKLKKDSKNPTGLVCQLLDTVPSVIC